MAGSKTKQTKRTRRHEHTVGEIADVLDTLIPLNLAQSWDNVGLLVGDRSRVCERVLTCIDLTPIVLAEAVRRRCEFILAYHPILFRPISRLLSDSHETDGLVHQVIAAGIAVYCPHTALDAAPGGTNDVLAEWCELSEVEPFEYVTSTSSQHKLVTFIPEQQLDQVAAAMFAAGGGRIGDYEQCSYRLKGEGTFFGTEGTQPQVGRKGQLEKVGETRLEMVVSSRCLPEVLDALLRAHPYEEPAYDIYPLTGAPSFGIGRVGLLPRGITLQNLAAQLQKATGSQMVCTVGKRAAALRRAAICVGAAGRLPFGFSRSMNCDVVITGEMRHHDALTILRMGKTAVTLGHWESERPVLDRLSRTLAQLLPGLRTTVSRKDVGPFQPI